jgi:hypothetical protein
MASTFLREYLTPRVRTGPWTFAAPAYVRDHAIVGDVLAYHRRVYLTQEMARVGTSTRWAGIRPRWADPGRYGWDGTSPLDMHYESLVEVPIRWQITGNDAERDILYGLGLGFQLRTEVTAVVRLRSGALDVSFSSFQARIVDTYDFDYSEHFTVPNPDHGSTASGAVCPARDRITVYHTNARRLETAGLAAPFPLQSDPWAITATAVSGSGRVIP